MYQCQFRHSFILALKLRLAMSTIKVLSINLKKVLVDEMEINLRAEDIIFYSAFGFTESLKMVRLCLPHIFIISENPEEDKPGLKFIGDIRDNAVFRESFIVYLTEQPDESGLLEAFESGADEILPSTVGIRLLTGHVSSLVKRFKRTENPIQIKDSLLIDPETLTVIIDGRTIPMVKKEFELLQLLCSSPNRIFYRKEILQHLWNDTQLKTDSTLDVHIRRLRKKLGINNIKTVNGMGYKFESNHS
jgi:two-component system alkaline phosphatase synthesis response regulator PhoP